MAPTKIIPSLLLILALFHASAALAWGPQGHALIADIASDNLSHQARQEIDRLLAVGHYKYLDRIASWADAVSHKNRRATAPWHYVDIPLQADHYNARRDCDHDNCIVARLQQYARILADPQASDHKRLEALKFVVHFVGDAQQPLHAASNHDAGGNAVKLIYFGRHTNLHRIWDSTILDRALHLHVGHNYTINYRTTNNVAKRLNADIPEATRENLAHAVENTTLQKAVIDWVNQAHVIAQKTAYGALPDKPRHSWSKTYQRRAWPAIRLQIQRGGIRLAATLNTLLNPQTRDRFLADSP